MNATTRYRALNQRPTPPVEVVLAAGFDLLAAAGLWWFVVELYAPTAAYLPLMALGGGLLAMLVGLAFSLRRGRAGVWLAQLVLLCGAIVLTPFPNLICIPLLCSWCGQPVRDWFDPPLRQRFGGRPAGYGNGPW